MGLRVLHDRDAGRAVVYNSTYETACSPVFMDRDGLDAGEVAEMFIEFIAASVAGSERVHAWMELRHRNFMVEFPELLREKRENESA